MKNQSTELVRSENAGIVLADIESGVLPDLGAAEVYPFDLMADYWTPQATGETKKLFFDRVDTRVVLDQQTNEQIELECAFFLEQVSGEVKSVSNGSKRLVGAIQANNIQRGTPLQISYIGKKKNKNNSYMSDNWSLKILRIAI